MIHRLRNLRTDTVLAGRVRVADTPGARALGLLSHDVVRGDDGIWLSECGEVDTYGMRVAIDVIFLDQALRVVATHFEVPPNRRSIRCDGATSAVQLGTAPERDVRQGDVLAFD